MASVEGTPVELEECGPCGMKPARGLRMIYEDGIIEFKCDCCGRKSRMGEMEHSYLASVEETRKRERSQENRDRYRREQFDRVTSDYMGKREEGVPLPSAVSIAQQAGKILNPSYEEKPDGDPDDILQTPQGDVRLARWSR